MSGKTSRDKGHRFELEIIAEIKEFFPEAVSARSESKRLDDSGVDIANTGSWNFQCKFTARAPNFHELIKLEMPAGKNVVFHKRAHKGTCVVMDEDLFYYLLRQITNCNKQHIKHLIDEV